MAKSLRQKTISGIGWRGATDAIQQLLQIVFTAILARLLTKADFGLMAMALLVNRFVRTMTQIGFGGAIIQSQEVTNAQISAIFFIQLAFNLLLSIIVFFCAGLAANFFNEPELIPLIKVIAWIIFLQTFQFPNILLRKNMEFKNFSIIEISSLFLANILAIGLAFAGFGVWSLVWRLFIQRVSFGILSWRLSNWKPEKPVFKGTRPLLRFGFNMLGAHVFLFFAENLVGIITGKYLGKEAMGVFNIAYNLAIRPASKIQSVLTTVLAPGFSKIQYKMDNFRENYKKVLSYTSSFFIPLMLLLGGVSQNLIPVIYGVKWAEAGELLLYLSFVGMFRGIAHLLRSGIISKGKANIIFYSTIVEIVFSLPVMYVGMQNYGIHGLIAGYFVGALVGLIFIIFHFDKILQEKNIFISSTYTSFLTGLGVFLIVFSIQYLDLSRLTELFIQIFMGLSFLIIVMLKKEKILLKQLFFTINKFRSTS